MGSAAAEVGGIADWGGEYEFPGYGPAMWWDIPAARSYATQKEELADLRCRAQMLTQELETVQKRIAELAKEWTGPWTVSRRLILSRRSAAHRSGPGCPRPRKPAL